MKDKTKCPGFKEFFVLVLSGFFIVFISIFLARFGVYIYHFFEGRGWRFDFAYEILSCAKKSILGGGFFGAGAWVLSRYYYEKDKRN
ncbi:hypothetical protein GN155_006410 [Alcanivorax sp. ZXX171]|nr:hypothetical protein [Alcanivorax sp. ZXX171]